VATPDRVFLEGSRRSLSCGAQAINLLFANPGMLQIAVKWAPGEQGSMPARGGSIPILPYEQSTSSNHVASDFLGDQVILTLDRVLGDFLSDQVILTLDRVLGDS
jgi:hypothetical protein